MVAGSEGHLRVDGDVEPCLLQVLVERCLDGALSVHDDRFELAFPYRIPVGRRDEVCGPLHIESIAFQTAEDDLEGCRVIKFLLDVASEVRVLIAE